MSQSTILTMGYSTAHPWIVMMVALFSAVQIEPTRMVLAQELEEIETQLLYSDPETSTALSFRVPTPITVPLMGVAQRAGLDDATSTSEEVEVDELATEEDSLPLQTPLTREQRGGESVKTDQPEGDRLGRESIFGGDAARSPSVNGGRLVLPPLINATTDTGKIGNGRSPESFRNSANSPTEVLPESGVGRPGNWDWTVRYWDAPNTFSHPRYFEDRMLERHGHERFPLLQPMTSGVRFFSTIPLLPYLMVVRSPSDCEYTMGYYRAGSCIPALKQRPPVIEIDR